MIRCLLLSHGLLARGMKESIEMIAGPQKGLRELCLYGDMSLDDFRRQIEEILDHNREEGFQTMVFVDIPGGTPFYSLISLVRKRDDFSFVTGMNLAMCLEVIGDPSLNSLRDAAQRAMQSGVSGIFDREKMMAQTMGETERDEHA